ncbi:MAG: hypothetical protein ACNS60_02305 [Candidatus Cyclobacteriaceae bacterium M2_1C_046]
MKNHLIALFLTLSTFASAQNKFEIGIHAGPYLTATNGVSVVDSVVVDARQGIMGLRSLGW